MKTEKDKSKNRESMRLLYRGLKKCRKCGEIKPLDQFAKSKRYSNLCNIQPSQKATILQKLRWLFTNKIEFVRVDALKNIDRGGFGTSGKK